MSRNARFIARLGAANTWIPTNPGNQLIDLVQGAYTSLPPISFLGTQSLSDDGMLLAGDSTGPLLWKSGIERRLQFSQPISITGAQLSSNGRTIVYEGRTAGGCAAFSYDVASAREVELGPIPCRVNRGDRFYRSAIMGYSCCTRRRRASERRNGSCCSPPRAAAPASSWNMSLASLKRCCPATVPSHTL